MITTNYIRNNTQKVATLCFIDIEKHHLRQYHSRRC